MKKIYAFILAVLVVGSAQAQLFSIDKVTSLPIRPDNYHINHDRLVDTIFTYFNRSSSFILWGSIDGGNIFGTAYADVAQQGNPPDIRPINDGIGNHYNGLGQDIQILEVISWIAEADVMGGSADTIYARVYNAGSDSMPTNLVGFGTATTNDVTASQNLVWSSIPVDQGTGIVSGDFVISWEFPGMDDTLGIVANDTMDGANQFRPKLLLSSDFGGTWEYVFSIWQGSWNVDVMMLPIFDDNPVVGRSTDINVNGLHVRPSYPNPSNTNTTIWYDLDQNQDVQVKVFDQMGRDLFNTGVQSMQPGTHEVVVDVTNWANGKYYYQVIAGGKAFTSRIIVAK